MRLSEIPNGNNQHFKTTSDYHSTILRLLVPYKIHLNATDSGYNDACKIGIIFSRHAKE